MKINKLQRNDEWECTIVREVKQVEKRIREDRTFLAIQFNNIQKQKVPAKFCIITNLNHN